MPGAKFSHGHGLNVRWRGGPTAPPAGPPENPGTLGTGLLGVWKYDEASGNAQDSAGGLHMTDFNTVGRVAGIDGNAGDFTAANTEYFSLGDSPETSMGAGKSITWTFWVTPKSPGTEQWVLIKGSDGASTREYGIFFPNAQMHFAVSVDGVAFSGKTHSHVFLADERVFVVARYNAATGEVGISINNEAFETAVVVGDVLDRAGLLFVGADQGAHTLDAVLDELTLHGKALSDDEIAYIYNEGNGNFHPWA